MTNINDLKPIQNLRPFTRFCCSIGAIPSSYLISLTYEEQLLWLCDYLKNTIIPTVNINGEAVTELQNLYVQLKNYVDDYFTNLVIQEEINKKLDEMAQSGELTDIIAQYLNLAGILAFNDINELKNATNLANGSICKTLGNENYLDGFGNFYKIRNILSSDVIDENNIIRIINSNTLIAEKIPNTYINNLELTINNLELTINNLELTKVDKQKLGFAEDDDYYIPLRYTNLC